MRLSSKAILGAFMVCVLAASARTQTVAGVIRGGDAQPVAGVVVLLLDSASTTVGRTMSRSNGEYRVAAPAGGRYRIRTMRIGYQMSTSPFFVVASQTNVERPITLATVAVSLESVRVSGRQTCRPMGSDSAMATYAIWTQVRTALNATDLTTRLGNIEATTMSYQRLVDRSLSQVRAQRTEMRRAAVQQPWQSIAPESLHANGYVVTGADDSVTYAAPGLDALLSDTFIADHCFALVAGRTGVIGVGFEPNTERRHVPEIRGIVWLDRKSAELQRLEFGFANLPRIQSAQAGGELTFVRLRDGSWVIPRWNIRMPIVASFGYFNAGNELRVAGVKIAGGELALAIRDGDTLWSHPPMHLDGRITDSVTGKAVAGARLSVRGSTSTARTDTLGNFRITGMLPGTYTIEARGDGPGYNGLKKVLQVAFVDSTDRADFTLQSGTSFAQAICERPKLAWTASADAILTGNVNLSEIRVPRSRVRVNIDWIDVSGHIGLHGIKWERVPIHKTVAIDEKGDFHFCLAPLSTAVTVQAFADSIRSLPLVLRIPADERFARADLTLDGELLPVATFAGTIVLDSSTTPVAGVDVTIADMGLGAVSNRDGQFSITEITAGPHRVSLRGDGYIPFDTTMAFVANRTDRTRLFIRRIAGRDTTEETLPSGERTSLAEREQRAGNGEHDNEDLPLVALHRREQRKQSNRGDDRHN